MAPESATIAIAPDCRRWSMEDAAADLVFDEAESISHFVISWENALNLRFDAKLSLSHC